VPKGAARYTPRRMIRTAGMICLILAVAGMGEEPHRWRSRYFPVDWEPGNGLHDVSYAGYDHGETPPRARSIRVRVKMAEGDSGPAIQAAIDRAESAGGGVVLLRAGLYRVDGLLSVEGSGVVLRGEGPDHTRLHFTQHEKMTGKSHLTVRGKVRVVVERKLAKDVAPFDEAVMLADAKGIAAGDDVQIGITITDAFVAEHGMTGVWKAFRNKWQPFVRRKVVGVRRDRVLLDVPLRYALRTRDGASLRKVTGLLEGVGVEDLALSNAVGWKAAWANDRTHALELRAVQDAWVRNVHSFVSPLAPKEGKGAGCHLASGGILVRDSNRVTVASCRLELPQHRGGGGNGYLFEVRQSSEVLFRDCVARGGRHNFIQNWGFGVSGCVWLRCESRDGRAINSAFGLPVAIVGFSEYHHSLATANLVDSCFVSDGWSAVNRGQYSSGAGHTATECVFWNVTGPGLVRTGQYGRGYVIGTGRETKVLSLDDDWVEGEGAAATLDPPSLYEAQRKRRVGR